jgi:hypothetical protein
MDVYWALVNYNAEEQCPRIIQKLIEANKSRNHRKYLRHSMIIDINQNE